MWVAKVLVQDNKGFFGIYARKYNLTITGYPVSAYPAKNSLNGVIAGIIYGEEHNKKMFLRDLRKEKDVISLESKNDFFILIVKESAWTSAFYNPFIIHVKPAIVSPNGEYIMELGSWREDKLKKLIREIKKRRGAKLLTFKKETISNIVLTNVLPELTEKQEKAIKMAIQLGYYNYPRKTELGQLAKQMNVSLSTFHEHLRIAERKIMPHMM